MGSLPPSASVWGPWLRFCGAWGLRLSAAGGLAYGGLITARGGYEYATTSPRFEVRGLVFSPTPHVDDAAVRRLLALPPGTNILALDLDVLAHRVAEHPWVARATVVRELPDTLEVRVTEHEAVAVLLTDDFYLVDAEGTPFKRLDEGERGRLPVVTGFDTLEMWKDPHLASGRLARALEVAEAYQAKRRPRLSEVHIEPDGDVTMYTEERGSQLRLGRGSIGPALARFDALRAALGQESDKLAVAHLDHTSARREADRVVASFFPSEEAPQFAVAAHRRVEEKARAQAGSPSDPGRPGGE